MGFGRRCLGSLSLVVFLVGLAGTADATSLSLELEPFTGSDIKLELVLDDDAGDGTIRGRLEVIEGVGDLRGLFLDIADTSLLEGLDVMGEHVTAFAWGGVSNLSRGNNVNGGGTPCPCDIGISFGSPGIGHDDLYAVEFVLSHVSDDLDLSLFAEQYVGARVTSVGIDGEGREGSSKLSGIVPVPEPGTAMLVGLGAALLGRGRRRLL